MASGVYQIRNTINDKIYIGSSINIEKRWVRHKRDLVKGNHRNRHLQRAWNKYGEENFEFSILEECEPIKEILLEKEQYYLNKLRPQYNILPIAGSPLGVVRSEEMRLKMSIVASNRSDETKERISNALMGHIVSAETREKMSKALKGKNLGHHHSAEAREKISKAHMGKAMSIETREKMSKAHMGQIVSPEVRAKISKASKGRIKSPETCEKISKAQMGNKNMLGKHHTSESIEKMSKIAKERWALQKLLLSENEETK